jgi:NADH dehydrogenase (ubiquinone) Fe-S protein 1
MSTNFNIKINGSEISVNKNLTVLQACEVNGVIIPRFCYHERLLIAGNCRMCLVEIANSPKPVVSCAMPLMEGMIINTNSPLVRKAREAVLEFLLLNHPLDCPICDQGGECDLQDQVMVYGRDIGRFYEYKRGVEDKNCGPLIKTIMTRCIHCTRCIRFADEIAGVSDLGTSGRGNSIEVGYYIEKIFKSELSGNIIDLCPVGALTSKPYAFTARSWELKVIDSIDILDAFGTNICINVRGTEIMRILPRLNEDLNEEWISDKIRFSYDSFKRQRICQPMVRQNNILVKTTWEKAFFYIKKNFNIKKSLTINAISGNLIDIETSFILEDFLLKLNLPDKQEKNFHSNLVNSNLVNNFRFNTEVKNIMENDVCLLIGVNPRIEAPLLNAKIRKQFLRNNLKIGYIGSTIDLNYSYNHLGSTSLTLLKLAEGKHSFCNVLKKANNPLIIYGTSLLQRDDKHSILSLIKSISFNLNLITSKKNNLNLLTSNVNQTNSLELGKLSTVKRYGDNKVNVLYLLNTTDLEIDTTNKFIIYQGHHGDKNANIADVVLPSTNFTEKKSTYFNLEGRPQKTVRAVNSQTFVRDDWKIIKVMSLVMGIKINTLDQIKKVIPSLGSINKIEKSIFNNLMIDKKYNSTVLYFSQIQPLIENYYMTDTITKASPTMSKCSNSEFENFNYIK